MEKKIARLVFLLLILSAQTFAQEKSQALKFDEFDDSQEVYYSSKEISLSERIKRFVAQIKKERGKKIYIIYYRARKTDDSAKYKISNWAERTRNQITANTTISFDNVILIDGGYREKNTLEYWIVPKNNAPPKATPTFTEAESYLCPNIYINVSGFQNDKNEPIFFSVSTYTKADLSYEWKVSSGKIIEGGEGKDFIKVDLSNSDANRVTVFVEVSGLPLPCEKVALKTVEIAKKPYRFDNGIYYNYSDLSARLDVFMIELNNNPNMAGYIIVYASRSEGTKEMERSIASVKKFFVFRRYDINRVTIIKGGFREYNTVETWLVPPGVDAPVPTPSVDSKFIEIPKSTKKRK